MLQHDRGFPGKNNDEAVRKDMKQAFLSDVMGKPWLGRGHIRCVVECCTGKSNCSTNEIE